MAVHTPSSSEVARSMTPRPLDHTGFVSALGELVAEDDRLDGLRQRNGVPPFWVRKPGFRSLVLIILEQQVSLDSARAALTRLERKFGRVGVRRLAVCDEQSVRAAGITRQKAAYLVGAARAIDAGRPRLSALGRLGDDEVRGELTRLKGVGAWSAEVYLLMVLRRADAWPVGDLALALAARDALQLDHTPDAAALRALAEPWRPWRAVAARLLWHDYLLRRGRDLQLGEAEGS